jgi:hypothetical protein
VSFYCFGHITSTIIHYQLFGFHQLAFYPSLPWKELCLSLLAPAFMVERIREDDQENIPQLMKVRKLKEYWIEIGKDVNVVRLVFKLYLLS